MLFLGSTGLGVMAVIVLVFFVGALLGVLIGVVCCVRYVRQELTARISPTMHLMQLQLDNVQSAVNLALAAWHAELHGHPAPAEPRITVRDGNPGLTEVGRHR